MLAAAHYANITTFTQIESPVGPLLLAADDTGLRSIEFVNGRRTAHADPARRLKRDSGLGLARAPAEATHRASAK